MRSVSWVGEAEGEGCLEGPSEGGTNCSWSHLHRGLGIDRDSVFPCPAGGISDNEAPFLTLKQKGERALGVCGDCV